MVAKRTRNNFLNGLNPLSYLGDNSYNPPSIEIINRDPTQNDYDNFEIGALWINDLDKKAWILVNKDEGISTWLMMSGGSGSLISLTGDTGGKVFVDADGNINELSGIANMSIDGNPGTNTLTWNSSGGGAFGESITGNSGGAVPFNSSGNINVVGDGTTITIAGNPGTNTLTASLIGGGAAIESVITDDGTATPNGSGQLNVITDNATNAAGSSVLFTGTSNTVQLFVTDADGNTLMGGEAGNLTLSGINNTSLGQLTLSSLTTGSSNTSLGEGAGVAISTGSTNLTVGIGAGSTLTTESNNVLINHAGIAGISDLVAMQVTSRVFLHNYRASDSVQGRNIFVGEDSGNFTLTGDSNSGCGYQTLQNLTSGIDNVASGRASLNKVTTGSQNVGIGIDVGFDAGGGTGLLSGSLNTLLGFAAGSSYTDAESSNVIINSEGVTGDSNVLRIGKSTGTGDIELNKAFICGIRGITTGAADAMAVLVDSANQLGTVNSSLRYKINVADLGADSEVIYQLNPKKFNMRQHPEVPAWGLIAEEVDQVFPQLVVYKDGEPEAVKYHDLPVLLLNEIKKLRKEIDELKKNS